MILSNEGIQEALRLHQISITPNPEPDQYTTSAVDLFLGEIEFCRIWDHARFRLPGVKVELNLALQEFAKTAGGYLTAPQCERDGSIILPPYSVESAHLLAMTREHICLNREAKLAARVEGRSSFARLGLVVHLTAPTIHAGFRGPITLEIINFGPFYLKLVPGQTRICQLIFERLESEPIGQPVTAFQDQTTPAGDPRPQ
jgi:dCTP deaminase